MAEQQEQGEQLDDVFVSFMQEMATFCLVDKP
jgi:hypothetical protein